MDVLSFENIRLTGAVLYPRLGYIRKDGCGSIFRLSKRQAKLLETLALCAGTLVTSRMLVAVLYGRRKCRAKPPTLPAIMCRLRQKLAGILEGVRIFHVRKHGYKLMNV